MVRASQVSWGTDSSWTSIRSSPIPWGTDSCGTPIRSSPVPWGTKCSWNPVRGSPVLWGTDSSWTSVRGSPVPQRTDSSLMVCGRPTPRGAGLSRTGIRWNFSSMRNLNHLNFPCCWTQTYVCENACPHQNHPEPYHYCNSCPPDSDLCPWSVHGSPVPWGTDSSWTSVRGSPVPQRTESSLTVCGRPTPRGAGPSRTGIRWNFSSMRNLNHLNFPCCWTQTYIRGNVCPEQNHPDPYNYCDSGPPDSNLCLWMVHSSLVPWGTNSSLTVQGTATPMGACSSRPGISCTTTPHDVPVPAELPSHHLCSEVWILRIPPWILPSEDDSWSESHGAGVFSTDFISLLRMHRHLISQEKQIE